MLESIITSKAAREILGLLFSNPKDKYYIRQLERLTGLQVNAVRRELKKLESSGFLISKEEGKVKYFWLNTKNPIYEEMKSIMFKTQIIGDHLKDLFQKTPDIVTAFIYGSVATSEESALSDIDLMVIGSIDEEKLHSKISKIEDKISRIINYTLISEDEYTAKKTDFIKRVLKGKKIFLIGSENDL